VRKSQIRCFNFPKSYASYLTKSSQHLAVNLHTKPSTMLRWAICFLIYLFVCVEAHAQYSLHYFQFKATIPAKPPDTLRVFSPSRSLIIPSINAISPVKIISENYYANHLGFFCSKELQIERTTKLPLKFRLGSVSYTDKMEGKNQSLVATSKGN
jgi:hypothetical protein